jgi:drug/metabolite transporter (DMT)-like permease
LILALALAAAISYGAADFLGGFASRKASPALVVFASQVVGLALLFAALAFVPGRLYLPDMWWGVGAGLSGALAIGALYAALARGRMGVVSPITAAVGAALPVCFGLATGERPHLAALAGIAFAFAAVFLVSISPDTGRFSPRAPGVGLALVSGAGIGALYIFLSRGHADGGLWLLVPTRLTSIAALGVFMLVRGASITVSNRVYAMIAASGAFDMGANMLFVLASHGGMLAIVAIITSLYPASTVILARIVLDERLSKVQWAGVAAAAAGVVLIAI